MIELALTVSKVFSVPTLWILRLWSRITCSSHSPLRFDSADPHVGDQALVSAPMRMGWCVDFARSSLISSDGMVDSSIGMYRDTTYRFRFDSVLIIHVVTSRPEKEGQNHRSVFFDTIAVLAFTPVLKKA